MLHERKEDQNEGIDGQNTLLIAEIGQKNQKQFQMVVMHSHDTQNKRLHF